MTRAYLGLALFDVVCTAVGFALLHGCGFVRTRRHPLRALPAAFFLGWALVGIAAAIGVCAGISPGVPQTLALAAAVGALAAAPAPWTTPFAHTRAPRTRLPGGRLLASGGAACVAVALAAAVVLGAASPADVNWDVWAFWLPKAEAIYYFHGLDTGLSGYLTYPHPSYPPLVPAASAATFHFMGGVHPSLLPLQQSLIGVGFVMSVAVILRRRVSADVVYPALALLVLAPQFWKRMSVVLPDQQTAYLLAAAALLALLWLLESCDILLVPAGVVLAAAALTKSEGFLLGLLLALIVAMLAFAGRQRRRNGFALAAGPAAITPWFLWLHAHGRPLSSEDYDWRNLFDLGFLDGRGNRLALASSRLLHDAFDFRTWTLVLPLTLCACILAARAAPHVVGAVTLWLAIGFAGLTATYWIGFPEIHWYLDTSGERVVATLPLVAGTVLPLLLGLLVAADSQSPDDA